MEVLDKRKDLLRLPVAGMSLFEIRDYDYFLLAVTR